MTTFTHHDDVLSLRRCFPTVTLLKSGSMNRLRAVINRLLFLSFSI